MLNMEVRVAVADTQFQMLEVQRRFFPFGGATLRLPQQMGGSKNDRSGNVLLVEAARNSR
jgi:enoyl-CoA hydratase